MRLRKRLMRRIICRPSGGGRKMRKAIRPGAVQTTNRFWLSGGCHVQTSGAWSSPRVTAAAAMGLVSRELAHAQSPDLVSTSGEPSPRLPARTDRRSSGAPSTAIGSSVFCHGAHPSSLKIGSAALRATVDGNARAVFTQRPSRRSALRCIPERRDLGVVSAGDHPAWHGGIPSIGESARPHPGRREGPRRA